MNLFLREVEALSGAIEFCQDFARFDCAPKDQRGGNNSTGGCRLKGIGSSVGFEARAVREFVTSYAGHEGPKHPGSDEKERDDQREQRARSVVGAQALVHTVEAQNLYIGFFGE
jgi:hypothetical protein